MQRATPIEPVSRGYSTVWLLENQNYLKIYLNKYICSVGYFVLALYTTYQRCIQKEISDAR